MGVYGWPYGETMSHSIPLQIALAVQLQAHRAFERVDVFEVLSRDALQVAVHAGRSFEDGQQFAVPLCPLLVHPLAFFVEIAAQLRELFGDALDPVFEPWAGQVRVNLLRLGLLSFAGTPGAGELDDAHTQGIRDRQNAAQARHPDAVHVLEMRDILRHGLRHDDGQVGMRRPLIAFQLSQPGI